MIFEVNKAYVKNDGFTVYTVYPEIQPLNIKMIVYLNRNDE